MRNESHFYAGFDQFPARSHDKEAYGAFIVERRPEGAFATSIVPLMFIGWVGVFGTLIPKDSGEKLSFLVTVTLALVFLTLEIDKKLAPAGRFRTPRINNVIIASYFILLPNFALLRGPRTTATYS